MLVLYGCSMLSGFPTTRDIPESCVLPHTLISDEPLVNIPQAMRESGHDVECCAHPGFRADQVLNWFEQVPQWWGHPSIFWVGRNDYRTGCKDTARIFKSMIERVTGEWWICAIPIQPGDASRFSMFDRCNAELRAFAGDRFLDPLHAIGGERVLPERYRLDRVHPTSEANRLIARWLIANTIGATVQADAA